MADEDQVHFEATFGKVDAKAQQLYDDLIEQAAIVRAAGKEVRAGLIEHQAALVQQRGAVSSTASPGAEALARDNALKAEAVKLDEADLEVLNRQRDAILEQAALLREMKSGGRAAPPQPPQHPLLAAASRVQGTQPDALAAAEQQRQFEEQAALAIEQQRLMRSLKGGVSPEGQLAGANVVSRVNPEAVAEARRQEQAAMEAILELSRQQDAEDAHRAAMLAQQTRELVEQHTQMAYELGGASAATFKRPAAGDMAALTKVPQGMDPNVWDESAQRMIKVNSELGMYDELAANSSISSATLTNNLTRLGVADAQASDELRKHGALTTEFLGALARGETTVSEFGYQIGATIGKFGGWATAAAATYGALGAVLEVGKGALDTSTAVEKLSRTIDNVNPSQANQALQSLSRETNVSMSEAGDAVFQFSRTFHNIPEATSAARLGLAALKLDNVSISDSVRASTAITQQYGGGLGTLTNVYNELSAAQREYNARISDMIPLLQKSSGAVANAGGDLTQLIQIGTAATRITQLGGSQVGTALYRSAATFLNPANTKGAADIQTVRQLGVQVDPHSITQTILNAIRASWTMTNNERAQLSNAIFGPQYGGRLSALFNPQQQQLVESITGPGRGGINPQATRGSLNQELSIELHTARESLSSFVNELGRMGAALGGTGVLNDLTIFVRGLVDVMGAVRGVVNVFDELPASLREAIAAATALRLAMLFFSRTRLGSTAPLITRVPGFRPSEATQLRGELAVGNRSSINEVKTNLSQTNARLLSLAAAEDELARQKATVDQRIADSEGRDLAAVRTSVAIGLEIGQLKDDEARLEVQRVAQLASLKALNERQRGLTAINRNVRIPDADVLVMGGAIKGTAQDTAAASVTEAASAEDTAALNALKRSKGRLATALGVNAVAEGEAAAAMRASAAAAETSAAEGAVEADSAALETGASTGGLLARLGGLADALDPLTIGLVALPLAFSLLSHHSDNTDKALAAAVTAAKQPVTSLQQLNANLKDLQTIDARQEADRKKVDAEAQKLQNSGGVGNDLRKLAHALTVPSDTLMHLLDQAGGVNDKPPPKPPETQIARQTEADAAKTYNQLFGWAQEDAKNVGNTQAQRQNWYHELDMLKESATQYAAQHGAGTIVNLGGIQTLVAGQGKHARDELRALQAFNNSLQTLYRQIETSVPVTDTRDPLAGYEKLANADIAKRVQYADDYSKAFGTDSSNSIRQAVYAYTALAQKLGAGGLNDADLSKLSTAQTNLTTTISTTVSKLVKNAQDAPTVKGATNDLAQATTVIDRVRHATQTALDAAIAEDKGNAAAIKRAKANADVIFNSLNDQLATVAQSSDALIKQQSTLAQSQVTGSSPEADITRQQTALNWLRRELTNAQRHNAPSSQTSDLQSQINTAQNALNDARTQSARSLVQGQGELAQAQAGGTTPQDQITVARDAVTTARNLLAFDRSHNAGQAAIMSDEKDLLDAENSLNQTLQQQAQQVAQDAQSLNSAIASLRESQTLDPIKQAQDAIDADTKNLKTIKPQDYQTSGQYKAAVANAQAQRNKDIQAKRDAIVNQDLDNLSFEYNTMQIGGQQYINGLEKILRTQKMTLAERHQIEEQIYQLKTATGSNLDLNVGSIKLPSIYEIRRAIGLGQRGELPGSQGTVINHQASVVVNVYSAKDAPAVGQVLDDHLNTSVRSAMRAKGLV